MDVALLKDEERVRLDRDLDEDVSRLPTIMAVATLSAQPEALAVLGEGRNRDIDGAAIAEPEALPGAKGGLDEARRQRLIDVGAPTLAGRAPGR